METINVPTRIAVHFKPELLAVLDEHRRALPDLPSRAETIRRAVRALASNGSANHTPQAK